MKQVGERIEIFRGEAEVGVATPAFGEFEASAPVTDLAAHALHFVKVGVHPLREVEPFFL